MLRTLVVIVALSFSFISGAGAESGSSSFSNGPLPKEEWTIEAKTRLAQMLVGEAGWLPEYRKKREWPKFGSCLSSEQCYPNRDWRIQPWVIYYRWVDLKKVNGSITFSETIQLYSAAVKPSLAGEKRLRFAKVHRMDSEVSQIFRRRFLRSIMWDGSNLLDMVKKYRRKGSTKTFLEGWKSVTKVVDAWGRGRVRNECKDARHWDGPGMSLPGSLIKVDCGETLNEYFTTKEVLRRNRREEYFVIRP